jgi:hypothetical protein
LCTQYFGGDLLFDGLTTALGASSALGPGILCPYLTNASSVFLPEAGDLLRLFAVGRNNASIFNSTTIPDYYVAGQLTADLTAHALRTIVSSDGADMGPSADYDPFCRCVLVASEGTGDHASTTPVKLNGVVLDGQGQPSSSVFRLSTSTTSIGSFRPSVRAMRDGQFVVSYVTDAGAILERFAAPVAPTRGPRWTNVAVQLDALPTSGLVRSQFTLTGFALDFGASVSDGSGIDAVHVWAFPAGGGAPTFLGAQSAFQTRADVAQQYGQHFATSGFQLTTAPLPGGTYTIVAYGHSSLSQTFGGFASTSVTVSTQALMAFNPPADGSTVASPFVFDGWAVDLGATTGAGVQTVHVWAFPASGAAPSFVGAVGLTRSRPDVAALFGDAFLQSGYRIDAVALPPGSYTLVAYALSAATGTFNDFATARITVTAPVPNPAMAVDGPTPNATLPAGQPFTINGWAVDRGAPSGTGVSAVHVWAFPVSGGAGTFVGPASYGGVRPDIVNAFHNSEFLNSGFSLSATLPAGTYDIYVFAYSTVANSFNQARVVRVMVQ